MTGALLEQLSYPSVSSSQAFVSACQPIAAPLELTAIARTPLAFAERVARTPAQGLPPHCPGPPGTPGLPQGLLLMRREGGTHFTSTRPS